MKKEFSIVKGFRDYTGEDAAKRFEIQNVLTSVFESYGFQPAETPVVELEDFVRGDNSNDEAVSDTFKLEDRGKRKLALRYEFTFQLKRLMQNKKLPYKRFQIGPVFRDEPVSENRLRQFTQCDVDIVGSSINDEAEIFSIIKNVFDKLGIKFTIYFNNRKLLNEILDSFYVNEKDRENVIREIDKLDKLPEKVIKESLKKYNAEKVLNVFKKDEKSFKKYAYYEEISKLKKLAKIYGVSLKFAPTLARGLSYYNGTIFEVKSNKMKETICAGGAFMFNDVQSVGTAFGLDRLSGLAKLENKNERTLIISLGQDEESIKLSDKLRDNDGNVQIFYGKPSKAMDYANSYKFDKVIFVGEKEVKSKKFKIKDMKSGKESSLKI